MDLHPLAITHLQDNTHPHHMDTLDSTLPYTLGKVIPRVLCHHLMPLLEQVIIQVLTTQGNHLQHRLHTHQPMSLHQLDSTLAQLQEPFLHLLEYPQECSLVHLHLMQVLILLDTTPLGELVMSRPILDHTLGLFHPILQDTNIWMWKVMIVIPVNSHYIPKKTNTP